MAGMVIYIGKITYHQVEMTWKGHEASSSRSRTRPRWSALAIMVIHGKEWRLYPHLNDKSLKLICNNDKLIIRVRWQNKRLIVRVFAGTIHWSYCSCPNMAEPGCHAVFWLADNLTKRGGHWSPRAATGLQVPAKSGESYLSYRGYNIQTFPLG